MSHTSWLNTDQARDYIRQAEQFAASQEWKQAHELYKLACKLDPQNIKAWTGRGLMLCKLNRAEDALLCADKALALDSEDSTALALKGSSLTMLNRHAEAVEYFDSAHRRGCFGASDMTEIVRTAIAKRASIEWFEKGKNAAAAYRWDTALTYYDKAIECDPQNKLAWILKGTVFAHQGKWEDALDCCDCALRIDPRFAQAWNNKGAAAVELGDIAQALECFKKAEQLGLHEAARGVTLCKKNLGIR